MEKIALNYALMIEMIRSKHITDEGILSLLQTNDPELFNEYGSGVPDWKSFISFYKDNPIKIKKAVLEGYQITFLTKGALKTLLKIKYGLVEEEDYKDEGTVLNAITLSKNDFTKLCDILSMNWEVQTLGESNDEENITFNLALK